MTPNCANIMSKRGEGFEEICRKGKSLQNSRKLRKVVRIYKKKLVFFEKASVL